MSLKGLIRALRRAKNPRTAPHKAEPEGPTLREAFGWVGSPDIIYGSAEHEAAAFDHLARPWGGSRDDGEPAEGRADSP